MLEICPPLKILAVDSASIYTKETFPSLIYDVKRIADKKEEAKNLVETDKYDGAIVDWHPDDPQAANLLDYIMSNCPDLFRIVVTSSLGIKDARSYLKYLSSVFGVDDLLIKDSTFNKEIHNAIHNAIINRYRKVKTCNGGDMRKSGDIINIHGEKVTFVKDQGTVIESNEGQISVHSKQAQLVQNMTKDNILKLLTEIKQELAKSNLPADVKDEVKNEVDGAEIQVKKDAPDKKKIADKLQNATSVLEKAKGMFTAAVDLGNMLGKAIEWCGGQWIQWR